MDVLVETEKDKMGLKYWDCWQQKCSLNFFANKVRTKEGQGYWSFSDPPPSLCKAKLF